MRWRNIQLNDLTTLLVGQSKHFSPEMARISLEPGEVRGLSFKAVILLLSGLLSVKMIEIICVWETWQQDIVHVSSKSGFAFCFVLFCFSLGFLGGEGVLCVVLVSFSDTSKNCVSHP